MRNFYILCFCFLLNFSNGYSNNYYVDPSFAGASTGSITNPWKDLTTVNNEQWRFAGGDTIFFKRGQTFSGKLDIWTSGTASASIVFMPYGSGASPTFQYALPDATSPIYRQNIVTSNSNYLVFDGFTIVDPTMSATDHTVLANIGRGVYLYQSSNITLKNLNISRVGIAVTIEGNNNTVTNCTISNLREIVNTVSPTWDDFGAIGVLITGSNNTVQYNHISECWAPSSDYTYDGGATEIDGASSNNRVMYNTAINNDGWMQINTNGSTELASDNMIAYNLLINNGRVFWFNFRGTLTVQNFQFFNNDIIETVMQHSNYPYMFGCDIAPTNAGAMLLKNNIFWIRTAIDLTYTITRPWDGAQMVHQDNLYHLASGSLGYTISATDSTLSSSAAVFYNMTNADPALWDYHVTILSPAYNFGQIVGLTRDFEGNPVPQDNPEAGIYEVAQFAASFVDFPVRGVKQNNYNVINWEFGKPQDPNSFVIERSNDGKKFQRIAAVSPASRAGGQYNFIDSTIGNAEAFYQIKALYSTGETFQSKTIFVDDVSSKANVLVVYPNPVLSTATLSIGKDLYNSTITIVDANGRIVSKSRIAEHQNSMEINTAKLTAGVYYVAFNDGFKVHTTALVKQ